MTNKQLSPEAQAVMVAATNGNFNVVNDPVYKQCIAAALRAIVENCVPDDSEGHWVYIPHVLAIANELEGK
jgi:hypothetical protein